MRLPILTAATLACGVSLAAFGASAEDRPPPPPPGKPGEPPRPPRLSPADREALFDARLAALHVGLKLTPDQEKLWPPVENALRAGRKAADERREKMRTERPADMIGWLRAAGEGAVARGEALKALADAAAPLDKSLSEDQKRRLPLLLHSVRPFGPGMGAMRPHHMMGMGPGPGRPGPAEAGPAGAPPPPPPPPADDDDDEQ